MKELELTESFFNHIPLSRPSYLPYIDEVSAEVDKVLRSGMIAQGEKVAEFEQMVADYCGTKYAIAVSSGTAGLYMCLKALDIGPGDEVITSPFSFIASSNAIVWTGAKPVFVDIDRDTYNIYPYIDIENINSKTKAILPIDVFGNPIDTNKTQDILDDYAYHTGRGFDIKIVLDSCEAFGTKTERPFDCAVYAFYPNKQVGMGEGGCIVTNSTTIDTFCRAFRNQGRMPGDTWLESSMIGYNFRMTDIQAAIGIVQLKHFEEIKRKRINVWKQYLSKLFDMFEPDIPFKVQSCGNEKSSYENILKILNGTTEICPFVFTVEVDSRTKVMQYLADKGIDTRAYFPCIHLQKPYKDMGYHKGMYPVSEEVASRTLALPFYIDMPESEVDYVCECLKESLKE